MRKALCLLLVLTLFVGIASTVAIAEGPRANELPIVTHVEAILATPRAQIFYEWKYATVTVGTDIYRFEVYTTIEDTGSDVRFLSYSRLGYTVVFPGLAPAPSKIVSVSGLGTATLCFRATWSDGLTTNIYFYV